MSDRVRVRIAPSPTGEPHVGTAYTALYNYCFAKSRGGDFLLRIEDTDQQRSTPESERSIFDALSWLGLLWDEGPDKGGPMGPYRQSERLPIYREHAKVLLEKGAAYRCFCTQERLADLRKRQMAAKMAPGYDGHCRALAPEEAEKRAAGGEPHVVRLKVAKGRDLITSFYDEIRKKKIDRSNAEIDDQVLVKGDGFPTYHLANVVDDHLMKITHVIRAEEWIPSTPKHILLYQAFGWTPPAFAHLSLLRNTDKSKVSKRHNPVSLTWFRAAGFTREALINFLGLMGYSLGDGRERFGLQDILNNFDLGRLTTTSPVFDFTKLEVLNEEHLRKMSSAQYGEYLKETQGHAAAYLSPVLPLVQERHKIGQGFTYWTDTFFRNKLAFDKTHFPLEGLDKAALGELLKTLSVGLEASDHKTKEEFEKTVHQERDKASVDQKLYMQLVRVAVTGSRFSLPLYESMAMLGRDRCLQRLKQALAFLKST